MATPLRLLLAEDSEDDAFLLLRELRSAGYDVSHERVETPETLHTALDQRNWDIVVSDFRMPTFTGLDALAIVRSRESDLPFIFVSGTIGEDSAVAAMRAGAQDYVMKGNLKRLPPAIARELRDAEARRQRRRAEEQLRSTSERMRAMFEASPLAFVATDLETRVKSWNPAAERMFGWRADDVLGKRNATIPEDRQDEVTMLCARALRGEVLAGLEVQRRRRDGSAIDVSLSIARTFDQSGAADGFMLVYQDITERRRLEAQFRQAQKMEAVGQLAGGVAHDFNNLLTVITSYCDFLLAELAVGDPKREDVEQIRSAADGATALSRQLLVFSRQKTLEPKVMELNGLVTSAGKLLGRIIGESVELVSTLDPSAGSVKCDPGQIEQIIMNLAINARDAMPEGGKLTIETRSIEMTEASFAGQSLMRSGLYAQLSVSDNGSGMDERTQARIFEPFFTTKEEGKGTGLGLATVYGIVKQCDGFIRLYSEVGIGSSFKIYLPRADVKSVAAQAASTTTAARGGTETVLVVEDAPAVRAVTRQILARLGYAVLEAPDAHTALHVAAKHAGPIDLLLTDMVMPGMSGRELAEAFTQLRPTTKVLYASGYTDTAIVRNGMLDPGSTYLEKPFTPESLARKVRDLLDLQAAAPA